MDRHSASPPTMQWIWQARLGLRLPSTKATWRRGGKALDGAGHGEHGGVQDVEAGRSRPPRGGHGDLGRGAGEQSGVGEIPLGGGQFFRVVQQVRELPGDAGGEDDGGGHDRAGQGPAADFVHAHDAAALVLRLVCVVRHGPTVARGGRDGQGLSHRSVSLCIREGVRRRLGVSAQQGCSFLR